MKTAEKKEKKLGILGVALMYVSAIMGAGFASGRETWQYFTVFGRDGYKGIIMIAFLFVAFGVTTSIIATRLKTAEMGRVIVPGNHPRLIAFIGYFVSLMLFGVLVTISAAGGAMLHQQFGINRLVGGAVIVFLVIITVIGGFGRISGVFRYIMPFLVAIEIILCFATIFGDLLPAEASAEPKPSVLAPTWYTAAPLYISYNIMGVIPIVSTSSMHAKSTKHAILGTALGGLFLALLAFLLTTSMSVDPGFSQAMDMPMLGFSKRLGPVFNCLFMVVLFAAMYAAATSNFYAATTVIKNSPTKNIKIVLLAILGFLCGLIGFSNVIAYVFPIEGILGFFIIAMLIINFFKTGSKQDRL